MGLTSLIQYSYRQKGNRKENILEAHERRGPNSTKWKEKTTFQKFSSDLHIHTH